MNIWHDISPKVITKEKIHGGNRDTKRLKGKIRA